MRQVPSRHDKVIILKGVFDMQALRQAAPGDDDSAEEVRLTVLEEAEEYGTVKNVTIFDEEEDGIVTIRFTNAAAARAFKDKCNGRKFDGRILKASIAMGTENFKKSFKLKEDKDAEEAKRLEEYSRFIEGDGDKSD